MQLATDGAPEPEENVPAIHGVQLDVAATAEEYVPAKQVVQLTAAPREYVPAWHDIGIVQPVGQ